MQKFIDKVKLQNLQSNDSKNKIVQAKKISFNNILKKKQIAEDKAESYKLLKTVKNYYHYKLKKKGFFVISNYYYKIQSILCLYKLNDIQRKRKLFFFLLLKNKCVCKLTKCVIKSISNFTDACQRVSLKHHFFNILKNKYYNTRRIYLLVKKKRIHKLVRSIIDKWSKLSTNSINQKFEKARDYYIVRKKRRAFYLWRKNIQDKLFSKNIDMIFLQLEMIAASWET
ncbi:conserved protein, unknown function [Hepatocystis sp. ex Piliocolobus tephrosceles]|nr:conserved protein, unknown function [Hepatocystis sp. ex Piliocolobus tephrosceles]